MGNNQYQKYFDLVQDKLIQEINTQTYKQQKFQQLEEAISILPNYYLAYLELFKLKIMDNENYYEDIEYNFNFAIELNPKYLQIDPEWVLENANYTEEVNKFINIWQQDEESKFLDSSQYYICLYNSIKQIENQNYYQAYLLLRIADKISIHSYEHYFLMGKLFLEKDYIKQALDYFNSYLNKIPNHISTLFLLAQISLDEHQILQARNYLNQIKSQKIKTIKCMIKLFEMFCQTYYFDDEQIIEFILELEDVVKITDSSFLNQKVIQYIQNCNHPTEKLYQHYEKQPDGFWKQYKQILLKINSSKHTDSLSQITNCLKQFTTLEEKRNLLNAKAWVLFQLNKVNESVNTIREILDNNMDCLATYFTLYECYKQCQNGQIEALSLNQTIQLIKSGIQKNISVGDLNSLIGKILFDNQKFNDAKQYFIDAIKQNSTNYRIDRLQLTYCYTIDPDDQFETIMMELNDLIGQYQKKNYKKY